MTITIGIPTCYGGESLIDTVRSIREVAEFADELRIVADRTPLSESEVVDLQQMKVAFTWNSEEGSQLRKLKQIVDATTSEIFIFTQDDITFSPETIRQIEKAFSNDSELTMVGIRIEPLAPVTPVETGIAAMVSTIARTVEYWNGGDNYLSVSGRCMAFRTTFLKQMRIPEGVVNADAYFYFENMRLKGKYRFLKDSVVAIRCPQTMKEQLRPSSRFQYSRDELQKYFDFDIRPFYRLSWLAAARASLESLMTNPYGCVMYGVVFWYTRLLKLQRHVAIKTMWSVDSSTKRI